MQERFNSRPRGVTASLVVGVEILLCKPVLTPLKYERIGFDQTAVSVIGDVEERKFARGLHDDLPKIGRIKSDSPIIINVQSGKNGLDVLLEPSERSIEVKKALRWAHYVLVPDTPKRLER